MFPGGPEGTAEVPEAPALLAQPLTQLRDLVWNELSKELTDAPVQPASLRVSVSWLVYERWELMSSVLDWK